VDLCPLGKAVEDGCLRFGGGPDDHDLEVSFPQALGQCGESCLRGGTGEVGGAAGHVRVFLLKVVEASII
jgi:hypothetical protein